MIGCELKFWEEVVLSICDLEHWAGYFGVPAFCFVLSRDTSVIVLLLGFSLLIAMQQSRALFLERSINMPVLCLPPLAVHADEQQALGASENQSIPARRNEHLEEHACRSIPPLLAIVCAGEKPAVCAGKSPEVLPAERLAVCDRKNSEEDPPENSLILPESVLF